MPLKERKVKVYNKVIELLEKYNNALIGDIINLPADIVQKARHDLYKLGETETLSGKSTVIIKSLEDYIKKGKFPAHLNKECLEKYTEALSQAHLLLIFTNKSVSEINNILIKYNIEKQAKIGQICPIEIVIQAGSTGLDTSQIELFQALKIPTKVVRNQLEITTSTKILSPGQKINASEINIMKKFNIKPYKHTIIVKKILLNGSAYGNEVLKVNDDYMKKRLEEGIQNILGLSLGTGVTTTLSAPSVVMNAFKNICALSLGTGVLIPATQAMNEQPKKEEPKKEEKKKEEKPKKEEKKKEEPKEEEEGDDDMLGGLF